jgi:Leu/Phe-tRNA-protein transferase
MLLRYTETGFLIIHPRDNPHKIIDAMLEMGYSQEFCVSTDFMPDFVARLMAAGFLVMSAKFGGSKNGDAAPDQDDGIVIAEESGSKKTGETQTEKRVAGSIFYVCLPKLHLVRSVLFFDNLDIKKSIKHYIRRYELRFDSDFDTILDRCIETHGDDWLTGPLVMAIKEIRRQRLYGVYPVSFGLYRNGILVAGEFGIMSGRVYTSYSGYYEEPNSGTVQLILAARYLKENGFAFLDFGMPLDYKSSLGATDISPGEFVNLFRLAQ